MKLIAGLGNPGDQYQKTRHNIGFMAVHKLQKTLEFPEFKIEQKFDAAISEGTLENEKVILAQPLSHMNNSGIPVQKIIHYFKIKPEDCVVICDDLDTEFGKIRIRKNGGPGTHNGLKSVTEHIGRDYIRIKMGIENRPADSTKPNTTSYVLDQFNKAESQKLPELIERAGSAARTILVDGIDCAMNKYN